MVATSGSRGHPSEKGITSTENVTTLSSTRVLSMMKAVSFTSLLDHQAGYTMPGFWQDEVQVVVLKRPAEQQDGYSGDDYHGCMHRAQLCPWSSERL